MVQLSPAYLTALATQIGGIAAFLGGFAATFLATLLTLSGRGRVATASIALAAVAAICFIVTVAASTGLIATLHPEAPVGVADHDPSLPRAMMALLFLLGLVSLLASVGASGWIRSRTTGWATSAAAAIGVILLLVLTTATG